MSGTTASRSKLRASLKQLILLVVGKDHFPRARLKDAAQKRAARTDKAEDLCLKVYWPVDAVDKAEDFPQSYSVVSSCGKEPLRVQVSDSYPRTELTRGPQY